MTHTFQAVWPIVDETMTQPQLIAEAFDTLPELARQAHAELVGDPVWHVEFAEDVPGWHAYPGMVLIADVPAHKAPRRGVRPAQQVDVIARLAGAGWTDQRIADALGCGRSWVLKLRHQHGIYRALSLAAA